MSNIMNDPASEGDPSSEGVRRYLLLASAARRRAEHASAPEFKESYIGLAQGWEKLALEVARRTEPAPGQRMISANRPNLRIV
jgi:hypothetical protein